jgi:transporter family protein
MWIVWALLAAVFAALVVVLTKAGLKDVDSNLAFAIQAVFIFIITWGIVTVQGNFAELKEIGNKAWMLLILAGVATTLSTVFSYKALAIGPASYVTTVERLSLVIAVILSIIFLKEKLTWQLLVGVSIMVAGAVLIALSGSSGK